MTERQRAAVVLLIALGFVGLGALLHLSSVVEAAGVARSGSPQIPGGLLGQSLVVMFVTAVAQHSTVRYRSKRRGSVSLSLGIFAWILLLPYVSPDALVVGGVAGYLIDQGRARPVVVKGTFNVLLAYTTAAVMLAVHQVVGGGAAVGVSGWTASVVAVTAASVVQIAALRPAMLVYDVDVDTTMAREHAVASTLIASVMGMVAAVCNQLFHSDGAAVVLAAGLVGTLAAAMWVLDQRAVLVVELEQAVTTMAHDERHDRLTGLPNRTAFVEAVQAGLAADAPLAVVLLDLNRFRDVNDTLGHEAGDRLLVETARRLEAVARPGDTVARFGDDEFAVLVNDAVDVEVARGAVRRLLTAVEQPHRGAAVQVQTSASAGVTLSGLHGSDGDTLARRAEVAMFVAKDAGEAMAVFDPRHEVDAPRRLRLAADLRRALGNGDLWVAYQPKLHLATGVVDGVEALCRWEHPTDGFIGPDEFIAIAERTGLIRDLTRHVITVALQDAASWRAEGLALGVAVNVSPNVLSDETFSSRLAEDLLREGLDPEQLTLEVTESVVLSDSARIEHVLGRIEDLGVKLSIDDYGTGYSSLSYLRRLRVDELKVDRSFVSDMITNANDAVLVDSTVKLGHALGLSVVAEGVEDLETLQRLRIMGCERAQGYFIAKPMKADDLLAFALEHDPALAFVAR